MSTAPADFRTSTGGVVPLAPPADTPVHIPLWTSDPVPGTAEHRMVLPAELPALVQRRAGELGVHPVSVYDAAHARVAATFTGDADDRTWRELVTACVRGRGAPDPALTVAVDLDRAELLVRYDTSTVDAGCAERIAGYHVAAVRLLTADPDRRASAGSLLGAAERQVQLTGMDGPVVPLPELRPHQLFEQHAARVPDAVAAVHRDRSIGYAELNRAANRLARALLARGLRGEDVVAVVTERNLDWLVSVLAIFKAGGAYLPVEPGFPADRVADMLTTSECRIVLTEPGATDNLPAAPDRLLVADLLAEPHPDTDLDLPVAPDQLAYIYFTSGSTGRPKGAMCEQQGMLNHLLAKIADFGITADTVVAQTAPQCFDISLWQLISALLVGGSTLIVEQEAIRDVPRYLDRVVSGGVGVLQVVPSFLDVVLAHLEDDPRDLGALTCVSATGEALKPDLARRWFAAYPTIALANAYGLTETSDDTNHEVLTAEPDRILLGAPVANVTVYVVDAELEPVPLGAPGEIVFSGVCVGRGYINDPERTAAAFGADPHRPGQRLYRSGDFGRWQPDGKLEFLGRRDSQVKIRGFRIEIGEIENQLGHAPGVYDGAVVVVGGADKHLVGFYRAEPAVTEDDVRSWLAARLPGYMVPGTLHRLDLLPLNRNGKVDKKVLTAQAEELGAAPATAERPPSTPTEHALAALWADVLAVPAAGIGRDDDFYALGGTSLSAIRLAIKLGEGITPRDLLANPVLSELAALVDARA